MMKLFTQNKVIFNIKNNNNQTFFDCYLVYLTDEKYRTETHILYKLLDLYNYFIDYGVNIYAIEDSNDHVINLWTKKMKESHLFEYELAIFRKNYKLLL